MSEPTWFDEISGFLDLYVDDLSSVVTVRNGPLIPIDTYRPEVPSVFAGLLARQATLATKLAQSPPLWDGHTAPLLLRSMVECLVTFRWIALDPVTRSSEYIGYGLGQAKLQLSKMQEELKQTPDGSSKDRMIQAAQMQEAWILSQRLMQFLDVNLGSWTGGNIRQMCIDTGDKELYDWWFVPHSACAHNTWQHVSIWNTKTCKNALHQEHKISALATPPLTLEYVHQSAKFISAMVEDFDDYYGVQIDESTILQRFEDGLDKL